MSLALSVTFDTQEEHGREEERRRELDRRGAFEGQMGGMTCNNTRASPYLLNDLDDVHALPGNQPVQQLPHDDRQAAHSRAQISVTAAMQLLLLYCNMTHFVKHEDVIYVPCGPNDELRVTQ